MFGGMEMEQRKSSFTSFIKPLLNKLQITEEEYFEKDIHFTHNVMPLIDVVEQIHHSFYFKNPIDLHFEKYDENGNLIHYKKTGFVKSAIQVNNHFIFLEEESRITHILNVDQIVSCVELS